MKRIPIAVLIAACLGCFASARAESATNRAMERTRQSVEALGFAVKDASLLAHLAEDKGGWSLIEVHADFDQTRVVGYWIRNDVYSDFLFYRSVQPKNSVLETFAKRWKFLSDAILKGLINVAETGDADAKTLGLLNAVGGGWPQSEQSGNLVLNHIRSGELTAYVDQITGLRDMSGGTPNLLAR
jgi:hypothetical protein